MAWATLPTWTDGNTVTSSFLNSLKTNFDETAPAKATASGRIFAATGVNTIAERIPTQGYTGTNETTTTTASYGNLSGGATGPSVASVTTGAQALLMFAAYMANDTVNAECLMSVAISGATTNAANDNEAVRHTSATANARLMASWAYVYPLTAGSNTFTNQYKVSGGTGSFAARRIAIVPF